MDENEAKEGWDEQMKAARLEEARAKAEKAREEVHHERSKRKKTDRETEYVIHKKWHDGVKAFAAAGTFFLSVFVFIAKSKK